MQFEFVVLRERPRAESALEEFPSAALVADVAGEGGFALVAGRTVRARPAVWKENAT